MKMPALSMAEKFAIDQRSAASRHAINTQIMEFA
jgi:hypothetical protein